MKSLRPILIILLSFLFFDVVGQEDIKVQNIKGSVIDATTKEKLAFVNIIINEDGTLGTTTDIDGKFSIKTDDNIKTLTFSFVGYKNKIVEISNQDNITVKLQPTTYKLSDIIIDGRNNPANRIIDSVYKYRDANNPKSLDSYYYKIYDNMVFTIDTVGLSSNDMMRQEFKDNDLMVMETVSEQYFQKPNKSTKNILANKISGLSNPMFVYMTENIQSIGFQEDFVTINMKNYVNPISKNSKEKYIFVLESTFKTENNDSIFIISFSPYKNTHFNSLKGTMTISSDNWAIQNIKAEPYKQEDIFDISIQQLYEKSNGFWFPKQMNTNISTSFSDGNGGIDFTMLGIGKSYITDIELNRDIDKKAFEADYTIESNAGKNDDVIKYYRYERLDDERLEATYKYIDSTFNVHKINFDKIANSLTYLMNNEIPIGFISLHFDDIVDYNIGNGWMLGLGLSTNDRMTRVFSIGGFGNYWFKAKEFNYGGDLTFNILRSKDMKLNFEASHKFERLGNYGFDGNTTILASDYKHFYTDATSLNNSISANFSTYFNRYFKGYVGLEVADKTLFNGQQSIVNSQDSYRLSILDLKLRIAFGEKFIKTDDRLSTEGIIDPVIWISYQKNLRGVFDSPYNFDKIEFLFRGRKETKYLGKTSLTAQLGYINGIAPITETFNIYGTRLNQFDIYCTEAFNTIRPDEFFCDKFAALYFSHNFKNLLFDFKKFHPEIIIVTNIAWGTIGDEISFSDSQFLNDISKGYYESGLIIDNIIKAGISKLGLSAFYRYGSYSYDDIMDNFAFKLNVGFSL